MTARRLEPSVRLLGRALDRLDEVLALPGRGPMIDATIRRFELAVEIFWNTLKPALEERGRPASATPAGALAAAWRK